MSGDEAAKADYRATVFLPETDLPMRAGLPQKEPQWLAQWEQQSLYQNLRTDGRGRPRFILHDGPPYANGDIHIGHAMNKILKDVIIRSQQMTGHDAPYVPGWDCHGLPIEWKIEEAYRKKGRNKDEVEPIEFRKECRAFAADWIDRQREQFKRLGILGDWDHPYTTMAYESEAKIVEELLKFATSGALYRGSKPVMWSPVEKTALAEAEVEYHDHSSTQIDVAFPVIFSDQPLLKDASIIIWTTTPWTIPANRAICFGPEIDYVLVEVESLSKGALLARGARFVVAEALLPAVLDRAKITGHQCLGRMTGADLAGTLCAHPWRGQGYDFDVPLLPGEHVTVEAGTGFVHTAPSHGEDDFIIGQRHGLETPMTVADDGRYYDHMPLVAGDHVYKVGDKICALLTDVGCLLASSNFIHSYPHSWRSKAPLIFRNTPQWFISMEKNGLREKALAGIEDVRWIPARGKNRIRGMVADRPDWVISRQRAWGVPITVFVKPESGEILQDARVNEQIVAAVRAEGADAWFAGDPKRFLGPDHQPDDWDAVTDILDVWFDSGCTHAFVLESRDDLDWPASLYLEGSDQHRGWFQSSLMESCGTRGRPPYEAVLTHGFTLDADGRKMSKSAGTGLSPQDIVNEYGADILRLWVMSTDYFDDVRIGKEIIKGQVDAYRKIRNTLRYLLGNLAGFEEAERLPYDQMPPLERWVLHRTEALDRLVREKINDFDFNPCFQALYQFCILDLSAFYFDVRKDVLYCDQKDSIRRRAARTMLDLLFYRLTSWFAPILVFTAEEVWQARFGAEAMSVHRQQFPETPAHWRNDALAEQWSAVRAVRRVLTGALEVARREKQIGSSLQAAPILHVADETLYQALQDVDLAEICITSSVEIIAGEGPADAFRLDDVAGVSVEMAMASGEKCQRCWVVSKEVGSQSGAPDLCTRCAKAVTSMDEGSLSGQNGPGRDQG
ncbi:isoleucine--tRNA ligase [Iodidimonas nitroreducens]|uniref:Isoleucine--tRNA ligase n=1 Tax=Iodidimonas nitroreducens TaxID=1236968 RepID=A0A5A7NAA0_9PROT|nr:isoleucine--tRNA ligase [Iodidimonas nitroreducens]GAK34228.1 isoleucine--tRNA ligase [alpha proteobacterium Q-1]GER05018.1 isoleucine--tRNA ligase [Iodidimonas nitroreducens]